MNITEEPNTIAPEKWEDVSINYSREATMVVGRQPYSAFQRNSFNALVTFENGDRVGVVLPENACREGYARHNVDVVMSALAARNSGLAATFMTSKDDQE